MSLQLKDTRFEDDDLPSMLAVIHAAFGFTREAGPQQSPFALWRETYQRQGGWGEQQGYPPPLQASVLKQHPDLYSTLADGSPTMRVREGKIALGSVNTAHFGCAVAVPLDGF